MLLTSPTALIRVQIPEALVASFETCLVDRHNDLLNDHGHHHPDPLRNPATLCAALAQLREAEGEAVVQGPAEVLWSAAYDTVMRRVDEISSIVHQLPATALPAEVMGKLLGTYAAARLLQEIEHAPQIS